MGDESAIRYVCIDVANGYTEGFVRFVAKIRARYPHLVIMAGNVVTGEMTEELILSGADIVKVGIGPGSVCTTRRVTGVGYPQLSAIIECADAAHGLEGHICADGGCTTPGDVAKAFGGGADFVMLGGMFAGHDESGGDVVEREGKQWKRFYGMSSRLAMDRYAGGVAKYRAAEGKEVLVPYRGPVSATAEEILGGVRSACTYVGARRLRELSKRTTFIRVTQQSNEVFRKELNAPKRRPTIGRKSSSPNGVRHASISLRHCRIRSSCRVSLSCCLAAYGRVGGHRRQQSRLLRRLAMPPIFRGIARDLA